MVSVHLFTNKGYLILITEDNGKGMDGAGTGEGHGLLNIKGRINSINGEVSYDPSPGSGTVATIRVPAQRQ
jgi:signal transduction histidine kinase